jgi:peptidyl-prolyl cis-trans isomerase B (cyclophilin B)
MTHVRNPILFAAIVACLVLLYGVVAAPLALAQDAPEDSLRQPETMPPDSLSGDQPQASPESQPAATEEPEDGDEAMTPPQAEDTTATPTGTPTPPEDSLLRLEDVLTGRQPATEGGASMDTTMAADTTVTPDTAGATAAEPKAQVEEKETSYKDITFAPGEKPRVTIRTNMGTFVIELWPDVAPNHCKSFVYLANKGFYDSLLFYRVVPGYLIQGGCPFNNGTGGPGYTLAPEFSNKPHEDGTVSASRLENDLNSAGSQFFICLGRAMSLDGKYTVFGKVVDGLDIVHEIEAVPTQAERPTSPVRMLSVTVQREAADTEPPPEAVSDSIQGAADEE